MTPRDGEHLDDSDLPSPYLAHSVGVQRTLLQYGGGWPARTYPRTRLLPLNDGETLLSRWETEKIPPPYNVVLPTRPERPKSCTLGSSVLTSVFPSPVVTPQVSLGPGRVVNDVSLTKTEEASLPTIRVRRVNRVFF